MAILNPLTPADLRKHFTHRGWLGFCPVYMALEGTDGMLIQERNGIPAWWLGFAEMVMGCLITVLSLVDPWWEPQFMFIETGEIDRG